MCKYCTYCTENNILFFVEGSTTTTAVNVIIIVRNLHPNHSSRGTVWLDKGAFSSDPLEAFVAEFVEEDVGSHNVHEHLHVHSVRRDVAALRRAQHVRRVPVWQLLRAELLVHEPVRLS